MTVCYIHEIKYNALEALYLHIINDGCGYDMFRNWKTAKEVYLKSIVALYK